jgi:hypothetical protein
MLDRGDASKEDIDAAIAARLRPPMGPITLTGLRGGSTTGTRFRSWKAGASAYPQEPRLPGARKSCARLRFARRQKQARPAKSGEWLSTKWAKEDKRAMNALALLCSVLALLHAGRGIRPSSGEIQRVGLCLVFAGRDGPCVCVGPWKVTLEMCLPEDSPAIAEGLTHLDPDAPTAITVNGHRPLGDRGGKPDPRIVLANRGLRMEPSGTTSADSRHRPEQQFEHKNCLSAFSLRLRRQRRTLLGIRDSSWGGLPRRASLSWTSPPSSSCRTTDRRPAPESRRHQVAARQLNCVLECLGKVWRGTHTRAHHCGGTTLWYVCVGSRRCCY